MAVWEKFGLLSPRFLSRRAGDPRFSSLPRAARFRLALEESGGLHALYGRFLAGRADLLPSAHIRLLHRLKIPVNEVGRLTLEREYGNRVSSHTPIRALPGIGVWGVAYKGCPVVVECLPNPRELCPEREWKAFARDLQALESGIEAGITQSSALDQFREWIFLGSDPERRRRIIANLESVPSGSKWRFPRLIPELQTSSCLAYQGSDEPSLEGAIGGDSPSGAGNLRLLVEALLEQSLLLSLVDADLQLEFITQSPGGRFGFKIFPIMAPVPVEWHYELLQYLCSTVSGNSARALHMMSRMCSSSNSYAFEQHLMRELSGLQPELKINIVTPPSVAALENNWRALAGTSLTPPLFLQMFHRQCTILGEFNGEYAPSADLVAESLWPVLGQIMRYRFANLMSVEKSREWIGILSLFFLSTLRQLGMSLEEFRDNDLAIIMDRQEYAPREGKYNRRIIALVCAAIALVVFLISAHLALAFLRGVPQMLAGVVAVIGLFVLVASVAQIR